MAAERKPYAEDDEVQPRSQLSPCSTRLALVRAARFDASASGGGAGINAGGRAPGGDRGERRDPAGRWRGIPARALPGGIQQFQSIRKEAGRGGEGADARIKV